MLWFFHQGSDRAPDRRDDDAKDLDPSDLRKVDRHRQP
jgi:hypothetical protein